MGEGRDGELLTDLDLHSHKETSAGCKAMWMCPDPQCAHLEMGKMDIFMLCVFYHKFLKIL